MTEKGEECVIDILPFSGSNFYPDKAKEYFQIVYDIDPNDVQAKQILGIK